MWKEVNLTSDGDGAHGHDGDSEHEHERQNCHFAGGIVERHCVSSRRWSGDVVFDYGAEKRSV
jgi:hypothetical protein